MIRANEADVKPQMAELNVLSLFVPDSLTLFHGQGSKYYGIVLTVTL